MAAAMTRLEPALAQTQPTRHQYAIWSAVCFVVFCVLTVISLWAFDHHHPSLGWPLSILAPFPGAMALLFLFGVFAPKTLTKRLERDGS